MGSTRSTRRLAAGLALLGALLALAGCATPTPPPERRVVIGFSATGTPGTAFGRYSVAGDLLSTEQQTFTGLPFDRTLSVPAASAAPTMAVSLVDVPPGSRLSCRITVDGRVVAAVTEPAPGRDARCSASSPGN